MSAPTHPFELAAFASAAVPGLRITELQEPQMADESGAITGLRDASGSAWIAVAPSVTMNDDQCQTALRLTSYLHQCSTEGQLPFQVPAVEGITPTDSGYVAVLPSPAGRPGRDDDVYVDALHAASLGRALASVHNLPAVRVAQTGVPVLTTSALREEVRSLVRDGGRHVPKALKERWLTAADHDALWTFSPTMTHSSLSPRSIWSESGAVLAITDFWEAQIADPASDLAWVLPIASDGFYDLLQRSYSTIREAPDLHLFTRAQLYSELALVRWLCFGISSGQPQVVAEAKGMLTELDEALGGTLLVEPVQEVEPLEFSFSEDPLAKIASVGEPTDDGVPTAADLGVIDLEDELASYQFPPSEMDALETEDLSSMMEDILSSHIDDDDSTTQRS